MNTAETIRNSLRASVCKRAGELWQRVDGRVLEIPKALSFLTLALALPFLPGCSSMIDNTQVHRPLPLDVNLGLVEKEIVDKRPASESVAGLKNQRHLKKTLFRPAQIGPQSDTYLGIVEFTDQGMLRDPDQFLQTNTFIDERLRDDPLVLVIFVHGWNHNASPRDDNLRQVREILINLRRNDASSGIERGNILGVYLGWPGNVRMPLPQLSYYSRMNAAERVGRVTCTEVILSLIAHAKTTVKDGKSTNRENVKTIVIGHSMGGLIVEKAFMQAMLGYSITNATTSDQLAALKGTQDDALKHHWTEQGDAETVLAEKDAALPIAETNRGKADENFRAFREEANLRKKSVTTSVEALGRDATMLVALMKVVEQWRVELDRVANEKTRSEGDKVAAGDLGRAIYHQQAGAEDSIHHILDGLVAWARGPQSKVDRGSESPFRKDVAEYLGELRGFLRPLKDDLRRAITQLDAAGNQGGATWGERMSGLWSETDSNPIRSFEQGWAAYNEASEHLQRWESDGKFEQLKTEYDSANALLSEIKSAIEGAKAKKASCIAARNEIAKLDAKLDLVRERPPADLVMLINPASEATMAEQMQQAWQPDRGGGSLRKMWRNKKRPWIISISSEFDAATRLAYPLAMGLARVVRGVARSPENVWMTHTAPHVTDMQTHKLGADKKGDLRLTDVRRKKGMLPTPLWIISADKETDPEHNFSTKNLVRLVPFLLTESQVLRKPEANGN